jgi:hypothetical protein
MLSAWERHLSKHYPNPKEWLKDFKNISEEEFRRFANLWLSEGIPFVFQDQPMIYEKAREIFLTRLSRFCEEDNEENDKGHLGITGSGQLGFSLNPKKFADKFTHGKSDLDVLLVSPKWFCLLGKDIKNAEKRKLNIPNLSELSRNMPKGFIDHWKMPWRQKDKIDFPHAFSMQIALNNFQANLEKMCNGKWFKKITIRVYKNESSKLKQQVINLMDAYSSVLK